MARTVQIEMLAGPDVGEIFNLKEESFLVGRGSQCALQVNSPHVSRQQCEMSWQGDQLVLENLGTVNHTYLNDRPIERVYVQDGDLITFCDVALRVKLPRAGAQQDPERTVAYDPKAGPPGGPLPPPAGESTVIRNQPPHQDTHPPGPLNPGPPPGPPPGAAPPPAVPGGRPPGLPPGPPPPGRPIPGGLGTGVYGQLSGQHTAQPRPPGPPPGGMPPHLSGSQVAMQAQPRPHGRTDAPSQTGMPAVPPGMPSQPGRPPGMPGGPPGMPGGPPGMPSSPGQAGPVQSARKKPPGGKKRKKGGKNKGSKGKGGGGEGPNLPLIRNVVLVATAVVVLLSFAYTLTQPSNKGAKKPAPKAETEQVAEEVLPPTARNDRTDQEILAEAQRLFNIGSTYLREYQIADENLWSSVQYMKRAKAELMLVPTESWPPFAAELDRKTAEAEGMLDQEFRRIKLGYVREKSAGNYRRAMEEIERMMRVFPERDDERNDFARREKQRLERLMRGDKKKGFL